MELPQQVRDRFSADDIPAQCYAVVGMGLQARRAAAAGFGLLQSRTRAAAVALERRVPSAQHARRRTQDGVQQLPAETLASLQASWTMIAAAPGAVAGTAAETVVSLRNATAQQYAAWSRDGERAVAQWHAQRMINQRADRMTRSVTPFAARAAVSARDAARTASASPTAARLRQAGRGARQAWQDYQSAVAQAGGDGWGEAAVNGVPARRPANAASPQR